MQETIFRKASLDRISSPEQLNDYIKVSSPSVWVVLAAMLALLLALFAWGIWGSLPTTLTLTGDASGGEVVCYLSGEDAAKVTPGMAVSVGSAQGTVKEVSAVPLSYAEAAAFYDDDYTIHALSLSDWNTRVVIEAEVPDGLQPLTIVSDEVAPISFLIG
ncbi:MAG: hypothetical protein Q4E65_09925 [Clostridia bacterium]|nr:hypothetical protein [Clostridia bacterium]